MAKRVKDFNVGKNELSLATLKQEVEETNSMLYVTEDDGEIISVADIQKKQQQLLEARRKQILFQQDLQKMDESQKSMMIAQLISEKILEDGVLERVMSNLNTAQDLKFAAEAYDKILNRISMLNRLDTVDGTGTAKEVKLGVRFKDANGNSTEVIAEVKQ